MTDDRGLDAGTDLLPCPFCGGEAILAVREYTDDKADFGNASVECSKCFCEQPWLKSEDIAVAVWNARTALNPR